MADGSTKTVKRLGGGIIVMFILFLCLGTSTYALARRSVSVQNNVFDTGGVRLNLNDGKPVIEPNELILEPGMTVEKEFFIKNESTAPIYYRIYFSNVSGALADVLKITVKEGEKVLCTGTANELSRWKVKAGEDVLSPGTKKTLTMTLYFPSGTGNAAQGSDLTFTLCADATQTKNNPDRLFD